MRSRRVVVLTPSVPFDDVPHAGGRYMSALVRHLEERAEVTVVAASTPSTRHAVTQPGAPGHTLLVGGVRGVTTAARVRGRSSAVAQRWGRRIDRDLPPMVLVDDLLLGGPASDAVRAADVVDLQWSDHVRLAGLVRRVAPSARILGTYHDVQSQRLSRIQVNSAAERAARAVATRHARWLERRDVGRVDEAIVFSAKDALLLSGSHKVRVVHPPLAPAHPPEHRVPSGPPTVLFVAHLARPENADGLSWLLTDVWPSVRAQVPDARLRIVGGGAGAAVEHAVRQAPGVDLAGFVPDLAPEYAAAWCAVVPLRVGAGVKFKTVEALVHGVPVVSTPVGAEGIGDAEWYAALRPDALGIAQGLVGVLRDPASATARARHVQELASGAYGRKGFDAAIAAAYEP